MIIECICDLALRRVELIGGGLTRARVNNDEKSYTY